MWVYPCLIFTWQRLWLSVLVYSQFLLKFAIMQCKNVGIKNVSVYFFSYLWLPHKFVFSKKVAESFVTGPISLLLFQTRGCWFLSSWLYLTSSLASNLLSFFFSLHLGPIFTAFSHPPSFILKFDVKGNY